MLPYSNYYYCWNRLFGDGDNFGTINISINLFSGYDSSGLLYDVDTYYLSEYNTLIINITSTYNNVTYPYMVRLQYCMHGQISSYKG